MIHYTNVQVGIFQTCTNFNSSAFTSFLFRFLHFVELRLLRLSQLYAILRALFEIIIQWIIVLVVNLLGY